MIAIPTLTYVFLLLFGVETRKLESETQFMIAISQPRPTAFHC